ncbi:hypothetical protein PPERSA_12135 [Pseudocohnilembus persalinus]|uniref:Potassium channel domain-containing protein n=1 Tax=Pseudocohnilembus persalinus TaxID=266149 RepID=A0A0V0QPB6_PSEPJ|nr:hypothetical protein PPERSA_12135 [Pseudocohnilembus persalinus]|eukprot:KRX03930.1 hypothetical protein PPERSA_12135 [Pseudocohnilembus persalinus]
MDFYLENSIFSEQTQQNKQMQGPVSNIINQTQKQGDSDREIMQNCQQNLNVSIFDNQFSKLKKQISQNKLNQIIEKNDSVIKIQKQQIKDHDNSGIQLLNQSSNNQNNKNQQSIKCDIDIEDLYNTNCSGNDTEQKINQDVFLSSMRIKQANQQGPNYQREKANWSANGFQNNSNHNQNNKSKYSNRNSCKFFEYNSQIYGSRLNKNLKDLCTNEYDQFKSSIIKDGVQPKQKIQRYSCIWNYLGEYGEEENSEKNTWIVVYQYSDATFFVRYVTSLYYSVITVTTIGYGDLVPTNEKEKICVLIMAVLSSGIFAYIINEVSQLMKDMSQNTKELQWNHFLIDNDELIEIQYGNILQDSDYFYQSDIKSFSYVKNANQQNQNRKQQNSFTSLGKKVSQNYVEPQEINQNLSKPDTQKNTDSQRFFNIESNTNSNNYLKLHKLEEFSQNQIESQKQNTIKQNMNQNYEDNNNNQYIQNLTSILNLEENNDGAQNPTQYNNGNNTCTNTYQQKQLNMIKNMNNSSSSQKKNGFYNKIGHSQSLIPMLTMNSCFRNIKQISDNIGQQNDQITNIQLEKFRVK